MKKIILLVCVGLSISLFSQETVTLRLKYQVGDTYAMKMVTKQNVEAMMSMNMNTGMELKIVGKNGENFLTESKVNSISMDMIQGGMTLMYSSDMKEEDLDQGGKMMKNQMEPMLKAVISATTSPLGETTDIKVVPEFPGATEMANQNGVVYPEKALKVGDSWTAEKNNQGMVISSVYTVKSIEENQVILDLSGKVGGIATGDITGKITVNTKTGIPKESVMNLKALVQGQNMTSEISVFMEKI